jgi:AsmA protein
MAKSSRLKKVLLIGIAGVVVLIIAAVVLIPMLVDVNSYRPKIESLAREKLGREVRLGELGLSVFPAIAVTVDGVSVADEGDGKLLEAETVRLGAELGPLLSGRLAIGRVVVVKPKATVRRLASGDWELAQLIGGGEGGGDEARVTVRGIEIIGGHVLFEDASVRPGQTVRHELDELDLDLSGLDRPDGPFKVEPSVRVPSIAPDTRVSWTGEVGRDLTGEGELELVAFELAALATHAANLGGRDFGALAGRLDAALELERDAEGAVSLSGTAEAAGLVLPREGAEAWRLPNFELDLSLAADGDGNVEVDRFDLVTGDTRVSARGSVETDGDERRLVLEIPRTELQLDELRRLAAQAGAELPLDALQGESVRVGGKVRAVATTGGGFTLQRIDLDGLILEGLRLAVSRDREGRFDFQGPPQAAGKSKAEKKPGGVRISARDVRVSDVAVRFEDHGLNGAPVVTEVEDLEISIEKWLPGKTTPIRVSGRLATETGCPSTCSPSSRGSTSRRSPPTSPTTRA